MKYLRTVLAVATALLLTACPDEEAAPPADLEAQVREEQQKREEAESRSRTMERVAIAVGVGALVLFVAGTAIGGSAARHVRKQ